jgi:hypothetical protein
LCEERTSHLNDDVKREAAAPQPTEEQQRSEAPAATAVADEAVPEVFVEAEEEAARASSDRAGATFVYAG